MEIDDELVAALDGAANPVTDNWLAYKGMYRPRPRQHHPTVHSDGSCTPGATPITGLTHMVRRTRGWFDQRQGVVALDQIRSGRLIRTPPILGSPAAQNANEAHFQEVINGELKETRDTTKAA